MQKNLSWAKFQLVKRDISKKEKEDKLIDLKNIIMRKCRVYNLTANIQVTKVLLILNAYLLKRREQIIFAWRMRLATSNIANCMLKFIRNKPHYQRNRIRQVLTFAAYM